MESCAQCILDYSRRSDSSERRRKNATRKKARRLGTGGPLAIFFVRKPVFAAMLQVKAIRMMDQRFSML